MQISSPSFKNNESIPKKFTCLERDINPELVIENIPKEAKTLALILDDPDAPGGTFVHWVMYNIPIIKKIDQNSSPGAEGLNTAGQMGYMGPCPPSGIHRYFFKLYALDIALDLKEGCSKQDLEKAMEGHILSKAETIGLFSKS